MQTIKKVFAYITYRDKLLIFSHPNHPEAGLQVPAGTVEHGEAWEAAAYREAYEETGLPLLELKSFLGEAHYTRQMPNGAEQHWRRFFHFTCTKTPPTEWERFEQFSATGDRPLFRFFWAPLSDVPPLIAEHDALLELLRSSDL